MKPGVLIVCLHADPSVPAGVGEGGGTHSYICELAAGLALRQRHCAIVTRKSESELPDHTRLGTYVELFRIDVGPAGSLDKRLLNQYHSASKSAIYKVLELLEFDVGVLHSIYWNSGRAVMEISEDLGMHFVHTTISNSARRNLEGATDHLPEREEIEREVFDCAFKIFSVSAQERADLISFYDVPPNRIIVVGRPVDSSFSNPAHDDLGKPRPNSFGRLFSDQSDCIK